MEGNLHIISSGYIRKRYALVVKNKLKEIFSPDGFSKLVENLTGCFVFLAVALLKSRLTYRVRKYLDPIYKTH